MVVTSASAISDSERYRLALQGGFDPNAAIHAVAISLAECANCNLASVNPTGDVGLMQINRIHWPAFGGLEALINPLNSMRAAFAISGGGKNFLPWCTYPGGCGMPNNPGAITPDMWRRAQQAASDVLGANAPSSIIPTIPGIPSLPGQTQPPAQGQAQPQAQAGTLIGAVQTAVAGLLGPGLQNFNLKPDMSGLVLLFASLFAILIGALIWRGDETKTAARDVTAAAVMA